MTTQNKQATRVVLSWLFVGLPLIWGVLQTVEKSLALFAF